MDLFKFALPFVRTHSDSSFLLLFLLLLLPANFPARIFLQPYKRFPAIRSKEASERDGYIQRSCARPSTSRGHLLVSFNRTFQKTFSRQ